MSSSASSVYHDLLHVQPVPLTLQHRILRWGTTHKDGSLLAALATVDNLDPDIEEQLSQSSLLEVLLAWANRPGRSREVLVERLLKEKRAKLLVGLAELQGLDQAIYTKLADQKSVTVRWALLANNSIDFQTRKSVAESLAPEYRKDNWGARTQLMSALGDNVELWRIFVRHAQSCQVVSTALAVNVDSEMLTDAVNFVLRALNHSSYDRYTIGGVAETLSNRADLSNEDSTLLSEGIDSYLLTRNNSSTYEMRRLQEASIRLKNRPTDGIDGLINNIIQSDTQDSFEESIRIFLSATSQLRLDRSLLATVVIDHQFVTPYLVSEYFRQVPRDTHDERIRRFEREGRFDLLIAVAGTLFNIEALIGLLADPAKTVEHILIKAYREDHTDTRRAVEMWMSHFIASDAYNAYADLLIQYVPARAMIANPFCASGVVGQIEIRLADNDRRWETFDTLVEDFNGTLPELLDTVEHLTK